jgi:hypothetical protein
MLEVVDQLIQELHLEFLARQHSRLALLKLRDQLAKMAEQELLAILMESELGPRQTSLWQTMDRSSFDPEELELS